MAQEHGADALSNVVKLMDHEDPRIALAASTAVLDRAYGKPQQYVETEQLVRSVVSAEPLTDEEWAAAYAK